MFDGGEEYWSSVDYFTNMNTESKKKKKIENARRFSDEQIRSMETMFESETKLEPRKKIQLAKELGLQPRQVAIWFQNKRARWKSKKIEKDYNILLANYNSLASQFETLKKEKQALANQLQKLNDMVGKSEMEILCPKQENPGNRIEGESSVNGENMKSDEFEVVLHTFFAFPVDNALDICLGTDVNRAVVLVSGCLLWVLRATSPYVEHGQDKGTGRPAIRPDWDPAINKIS
ncbi:unnamed protein product [Fraxinus pennsylvanica]|uniref:Homeobox-leucine zipper protein n=1 Tax=Fraxinus pennsylvanica TaxID=56036 RepID=A0AAD1ZKU4_9LAMI|nr:unnamed protein product [Fraxinus pennsylvanica]